jgi:hypothetical protein
VRNIEENDGDGAEQRDYWDSYSWNTPKDDIQVQLERIGDDALAGVFGDYDIIVANRDEIYTVDAYY